MVLTYSVAVDKQKTYKISVYIPMKEENKDIDPKILKEIKEAVGNMKYGEVVITIHDSKVVQIEEKKKKRFN